MSSINFQNNQNIKSNPGIIAQLCSKQPWKKSSPMPSPMLRPYGITLATVGTSGKKDPTRDHSPNCLCFLPRENYHGTRKWTSSVWKKGLQWLCINYMYMSFGKLSFRDSFNVIQHDSTKSQQCMPMRQASQYTQSIMSIISCKFQTLLFKVSRSLLALLVGLIGWCAQHPTAASSQQLGLFCLGSFHSSPAKCEIVAGHWWLEFLKLRMPNSYAQNIPDGFCVIPNLMVIGIIKNQELTCMCVVDYRVCNSDSW